MMLKPASWEFKNASEIIKIKDWHHSKGKQWLGGGGWISRAQRFLGQWEYSVWYYNDGYIHKFVQTNRMYTKSES